MQELDASAQELLVGLNAIAEASYEATTPQEFQDLLDALDLLKRTAVGPYLLDAVWAVIITNRRTMNDNSEFALHAHFKRELLAGAILPGWAPIMRKNDPRHLPDFWLQHFEEIRPVEIKRFVFDAAAVRQLRRYMDFYNCKMGFAVAPTITCELPNDMVFIKIDLPK